MCDGVNLGVLSRADLLRELDQARRVRRVVGAPRGGFEQSGPFQRFTGQRRNASLELFTKLTLPPAKGVRPGFDRVFVDGVLVEGTDAAPAVVVDERHGRFVPVILSENAPLQESGGDIVP